MTRRECLDKAAECVLKDRASQYGTPEDNFGRIAKLWSTYTGTVLDGIDVAMMMALLKVARIRNNKAYSDGFIDLAGYAACGAELAGRAEAYRQTIEAAGEEYKKLRPEAEGDAKAEGCGYKQGDKVLVAMPDGEDVPCIYVGESERPGCCCVRYLSGDNGGDTDDTVPLEALRRPSETESGCCQNGNGHSPEASAEPKFKRGDTVEVQMLPDSNTWVSAVITAVYRDKDSCEWRYCVDFDDGWTHVVVPSARVRRVPVSKAEGCEALVEQDAPQTPDELYDRIIANNPATFKARTPTGEELAEMAEEEPHG